MVQVIDLDHISLLLFRYQVSFNNKAGIEMAKRITGGSTYQNHYEAIAHNQRRQFINQGKRVSLIAYNADSDTYDFDVYDD